MKQTQPQINKIANLLKIDPNKPDGLSIILIRGSIVVAVASIIGLLL